MAPHHLYNTSNLLPGPYGDPANGAYGTHMPAADPQAIIPAQDISNSTHTASGSIHQPQHTIPGGQRYYYLYYDNSNAQQTTYQVDAHFPVRGPYYDNGARGLEALPSTEPIEDPMPQGLTAYIRPPIGDAFSGSGLGQRLVNTAAPNANAYTSVTQLTDDLYPVRSTFPANSTRLPGNPSALGTLAESARPPSSVTHSAIDPPLHRPPIAGSDIVRSETIRRPFWEVVGDLNPSWRPPIAQTRALQPQPYIQTPKFPATIPLCFIFIAGPINSGKSTVCYSLQKLCPLLNLITIDNDMTISEALASITTTDTGAGLPRIVENFPRNVNDWTAFDHVLDSGTGAISYMMSRILLVSLACDEERSWCRQLARMSQMRFGEESWQGVVGNEWAYKEALRMKNDVVLEAVLEAMRDNVETVRCEDGQWVSQILHDVQASEVWRTALEVVSMVNTLERKKEEVKKKEYKPSRVEMLTGSAGLLDVNHR